MGSPRCSLESLNPLVRAKGARGGKGDRYRNGVIMAEDRDVPGRKSAAAPYTAQTLREGALCLGLTLSDHPQREEDRSLQSVSAGAARGATGEYHRCLMPKLTISGTSSSRALTRCSRV
jgi:hypothetical protein